MQGSETRVRESILFRQGKAEWRSNNNIRILYNLKTIVYKGRHNNLRIIKYNKVYNSITVM